MLTSAHMGKRDEAESDPREGARLANLRKSLGVVRVEVTRQTGITPTTQRALENTGKGYRLAAYREFLERLAAGAEGVDTGAPPEAVKSFIASNSATTNARPLALVLHELSALFGGLPPDQVQPAARTFMDVQERLDDGTADAVRTLEAAAQVTITAFSQFIRHENHE